MTDITLQLPDTILKQIQSEAERLNLPVETFITAVFEHYFEEETEPTKEMILTDLRISFQQALAGQTRPAEDVLNEIAAELGHNADDR